jgi:hypothetical protein
VGEITMRRPHVNFAVDPAAGKTDTGKNQGFDKMLRSFFLLT